MKKNFITLIVAVMFLTAANAQLPNASFESWNITPYDEPNGWFTGNPFSLQSHGVPVVTKVAGVSGFAVRMETMIIGADTLQTFISNSQGDPILGQGGIPYSQQPSVIKGYCRYNLPGNDTALLLVIFKNNGAIISTDVVKFRGTGTQSSFAFFSFPLSLGSAPDSVVIAATSSNLIDNVGIENGSFLELDSLSFDTGFSPIPDGNFDNWTSYTYDLPLNWNTVGKDISRTTDHVDGTYALSLMTSTYGNNDIAVSAITTGYFPQNSGPVGGLPYSLNSDTLTGYYKFSTPGNDSAYLQIFLTSNSNFVGGAGYAFHPAASYTYFEVPIVSFATPDTMRIDIYSSSWPFTPSSIGNHLLVDGLSLKSQSPTGIHLTVDKGDPGVMVFPNPSSDVLTVVIKNKSHDDVKLVVRDISGRTIKETTFNTNSFQLDVNELPAGMYFLELTNATSFVSRKFVKN
ncbi:MAG: T9SS type A sorting domain-containing protein [Bacteroidetes bacterium]|nr:T9SS type A sorting domain-containing protein [Bacteroidota bacterium]